MSNLSPSARRLLEAGRRAYQSQPGDRERVTSALRARLGPEALPLPAAPSASPRLGRWQLAGAAIGTGVVATLVTLWALDARPAAKTPQLTAAAPAAAPLAPLAPPVAAPAPPAADEPARATPAQAARAPAARSGGRPDALAQEVQLLARATRNMRAGQAARALTVLDEHQRRFPSGVLSEERRAARAQALCALGRVAEGRAEQAALPAHSPTAARAAQACDAPAKPGQTP
jgi:hypothetical protein